MALVTTKEMFAKALNDDLKEAPDNSVYKYLAEYHERRDK